MGTRIVRGVNSRQNSILATYASCSQGVSSGWLLPWADHGRFPPGPEGPGLPAADDEWKALFGYRNELLFRTYAWHVSRPKYRDWSASPRRP